MTIFGRQKISKFLFRFFLLLIIGFLIMKMHIVHNIFQKKLNHKRTVVINEMDENLRFMKKLENQVNRKLHTFIVEEHHEVLPYWFEAANRGMIPKSNITLIHVDGHSDMATPIYIPGFPLFRWPSKADDIRYMMQENDVFIIAAAMTGLLQNVVWIWPKWDEPNHDLNYTRMYIEIGRAKVLEGDLKVRQVICVCYQEDGKQEKECMYPSLFSRKDEDEIEINPKYCMIKNRILYEEIREDFAMDILKERKGQSGAVILDIDEDFYSCTYASMPLVNTNTNFATLSKIHEVLNELFCPTTSKGERQLDALLVDIIRTYRKPFTCRSNKLACTHNIRTMESRSVLKHRMLEWIPHLCNITDTSRNRLLASFFILIGQLSYEQLGALAEVGFCIRTSRLSINLIPKNRKGFSICAGNNSPNHTAVLEHVTNSREIVERTKTLRDILSTLSTFQTPKLITVCRSVRDGYTPRKYFQEIEKSILKSLSQSFWNVHVRYDEGLLGGARGWRQDFQI